MAPVLCISLWVFGVLALTGIHLTFYSLMLLPLVVILAIDHNLHFLQCYSERRAMWPSLALVGRAMLTTSLATMVGFGSLVFAKHAGLYQVGMVVVCGNGLAFLGSVTLLPALERLRELGAGAAGIVGLDTGVEEDFRDP
jgi:predicted RND superfamily exporter protein